MRPREHELIDPEIAEQIDAIDATLAGEPVAPRFAELAELALLLSVSRPEGMRPEFAAELDRRVEARFRQESHGAVVSGGSRASAGGPSRRWRSWSLTPVFGTAAAALAAVVVAVVMVTSGSGTGNPGGTVAVVSHAAKSAPSSGQAIRGPVQRANGGGGQKSTAPRVPLGPVPEQNVAQATGSVAAAPPSPVSGGSINGAASPAPLPNGRKIVQSSTLQLGAPANRIDAVAQGVFNVVGMVNGIVDRSNVSSTGGPGASAEFQLRVPSAQLALALTDLSRLRYAHVISRTDNTQDVNSSFVSAQRQIANAQAALVRLRSQLAAATLATEIAGLQAQIANEKATIARVQASLRSLNHQVDYSRLTLSIQATPAVGPPLPPSGGGGFGLHKAGHDALRVLEVTAGIALIALAVLVPLGLLAALAWWLAVTVLRRRRERALDLA